jgi:hypothetical protein
VISIYVTCFSAGICIAQRVSGLNTAVRGKRKSDGSRDNGIFQVSSRLFYNKTTKSLASIVKIPHAWGKDILQKATTAPLLSKFFALKKRSVHSTLD